MANSLGTLTLDLVARIGRFVGPLQDAERQTRRSSQRIQQDLMGISAGAKSMLSSFAGISAIYSAIDAADKFTGLRNRLILVTDGQTELNKAMAVTFDIAQRTGTAWDNAAVVYQRFAQNADALSLSQARVAAITETVSKAVSLSGSSTEAANAALTQFGQALASGVLRGEEFNSVMEQTPGLAQAIAKGLGVPIGQLRNLAQTGQITADQLVKALEKVAPEVAKDFDKTAFTISQSFVQVKDAYVKLVGESNGGAAAALASSLSGVAKNLDLIANTGAAVAIGYFTKTTLAGAGALATKITALNAERAATIANLQTTVRAAQAEHTRALAIAEDTAMQLAAARADMTRLTAMQRLSYFQTVILPLQKAAEATKAAEAAASATLTGALNAEAAATSRLAAAKRMLLGLFGGRAGLIGVVATVAAGMYLFSDSADVAKVSIDDLGNSAAEAAAKFRDLTLAQQKDVKKTLSEKLREEESKIASSANRIQDTLNKISIIPGADTDKIDSVLERFKKGTISATQIWVEFKDQAGIPQHVLNDLEDYTNKNADAKAELNELNEKQKAVVATAEQQSAIDRQLAAYTQALGVEVKNNKEYYDNLRVALLDTATAAKDPALTRDVQKALAELAKGAKGAEERTLALIAAMPVPQATRDTLSKYLGVVVDSAAAQKTLNQDIKDAERARNGEAIAIEKQTKALQDYFSKTKQGFINSKVQLALQNKGYSPAQSSALTEAQAAAGFDQNGQAIKLTEKQVEFILQGVAAQDDLNDSTQKYNDLIKKNNKEESDAAKQARQERERRQNAYDDMVKSSRSELQVIDDKYIQQMALVKEFGVKNKAEQAKLTAYVKAQHSDDVEKYTIALNEKIYSYSEYAKTEEEKVKKHYAKLRDEAKLDNDLRHNSVLVDDGAGGKVRKKAVDVAVENLNKEEQLELAKIKNTNAFRLLEAQKTTMSEIAYMQRRYELEREEIIKNSELNPVDKENLLKANRMNEMQDVGKAQDRVFNQYASAFPPSPGKQIQDSMDSEVSAQADLMNQGLISYEQYQKAYAEIGKKYEKENNDLSKKGYFERMGYASQFFGDMTVLTRSSSKKIAKIGRQAAIFQATIDGVASVQKTLASVPYPWNIPLGIAAGAVAVANVAAIKAQQEGYADGGFTGYGGKYEPAGTVHRGEVVWSQQNVRDAGGVSNVEALRTGKLTKTMAQASECANVQVTVNNYAAVDVKTRADGNGVTIDVVERVVAEQAPKAAANAMYNPNSELSKAIRTTTTAERRR